MMDFIFNGHNLPAGVGITSFVVSTPRVDFRTLDVPYKRGDIRTGRKYGNRSIQLNVVLMGTGYTDTLRIARELAAWCQSDGEAAMYLPGTNSSYIMCECETFPPIDFAKPGDEFNLVFKAHKPDFYSTTTNSKVIDATVANIGGTLPVNPTIRQTIVSAITDPGWLIDSDRSISLVGEVHAGELVIDTEHETVKLDGEDITDMVSLDSDLGFTLTPGTHLITAYNGAGGTLYWKTSTLWGE